METAKPVSKHMTARARARFGYFVVAAKRDGRIVATRTEDDKAVADWWEEKYASDGREVLVTFVPGTVDLPDGYNA